MELVMVMSEEVTDPDCIDYEVGSLIGKYVVAEIEGERVAALFHGPDDHAQIAGRLLHITEEQDHLVLGGGKVWYRPDEGLARLFDSSCYYGGEPMAIREELAEALKQHFGTGPWKVE